MICKKSYYSYVIKETIRINKNFNMMYSGLGSIGAVFQFYPLYSQKKQSAILFSVFIGDNVLENDFVAFFYTTIFLM